MENRTEELTPPQPVKTPEDIEREMLHTRESLTEKVVALENQVVGTVQNAADTLSGTVESVKSFMSTAPGAVSDSVKQAASAVGEKMKEVFDFSSHVRERPFAAVGVSALLGCLTGWLLSRERDGSSRAVAPVAAPVTAYTPPSPVSSGPGMFDELFSMLGRKVREVAETAIETATTTVNKTVRDGVPKLVDAATEMAAERMTTSEPAGSRFAGRGDDRRPY